MLRNFHDLLSSADFFQNELFQKILSVILSVLNILDPDQAQQDLNCLQSLSADDKR